MWCVVSVTRQSSGVAPRACVRVYARVLVLVPPNLYIHAYIPSSPPSSTAASSPPPSPPSEAGATIDDFKKSFVDPYHKKELKAARKNGESGCWLGRHQ